MGKKVHLSYRRERKNWDWRSGRPPYHSTLCGVDGYDIQVTDRAECVTCKNCLRIMRSIGMDFIQSEFEKGGGVE